ncbi:MAG: AI-2 transport protein TqsA [Patescibacteria group bacterium]|jgi:AI-2 transport protein TqsA
MNSKKLSEYSLIFIAVAVLLFILQMFQGFLRPLAISLLLSFLFTPIFRLPQKEIRTKIWNIVIVSLVILIFVFLVSSSVVRGISNLEGISDPSEGLENFSFSDMKVSILGGTFFLSDYIDESSLASSIAKFFTFFIGSITSFASELFLIILFLIFLLPAERLWLDQIQDDLESKESRKILIFMKHMEHTITEYIKAKSIISFGTAFSSLLIMMFLGIDHFLLFFVLLFVLNFIPTFGDYISFVIIFGIQILTIGIGLKFFALLILLLGVQILFAHYLEPRYTGKKLELSPLTVLISLLFWGAIWGIGGMIFSIPLTLAIKTLLGHFDVTSDIAKYII